jgi:hypothetical protein
MVLNPIRGSDDLYIGVKESMSWTNAQLYCELHYGTDLATIESYSENLLVRDAASKIGIDKNSYLWIGLKDIKNEGIFEWQDKTELIYTNWGYNQPDNLYDQDCVSLQSNNNWGDASCNVNLYFVCNAPTDECSMDVSELGETSFLNEWYHVSTSQLLYRPWSLFTNSNGNWAYRSTIGNIWKEETEDITIPLYEYASSTLNDRFYTTKIDDYSSYKISFSGSPIGYIMKKSCWYNTPLFHYYNSKSRYHFYTTIFRGEEYYYYVNDAIRFDLQFIEVVGYIGKGYPINEYLKVVNEYDANNQS